MVVCPTKRNVQDIMKFGYCTVAAQADGPDLRTDHAYSDAQLIDLHSSFPLLKEK